MTMKLPSLAACCAALMVSLLGACGGGEGGGGGDALAGIGSGGTGSASNGPVTGFGSIIVNGIHFDQTKAKVTGANGLPLLPTDIKLGMVVDLDGSSVSKAGGRESAEALNIRIRSALLGKVEGKSADTLTIMGQTVKVSAQTHFGDGLPSRLDSVMVSDLVEVYGFHDAGQDVFVATRIERKPAGTLVMSYQVRGVIQDLDLVNGRCRIGKQVIDYKWIRGGGVIDPVNGDVAIAKVNLTPTATPQPDGSVQYSWTGTMMSVDKPVSSDQGDASVDGLVSSKDAANRFAVNGVAVDASKIACGKTCDDLKVGDHVTVSGSLSRQVVTATSVSAAAPF